MITRKPNHDEQQAISAARYMLLERCPYYAAAAFQLPILVVDGVDAMGCDRKGRVYIGTEALKRPPDEVAAWVEHELWHILREHAMRLGGLPVREAAAIAGCIELNDDLDQEPKPSQIGLPDGQTAEWYYRQLCDMIDQNGGTPDGAGDGCGSGGGGDAMEWEVDDDGNLTDENGDPVTDSDGNPIKADDFDGIARELAARAVAEQLQKQPPGNVPGGMLRWAAEQLGVPELPWQAVLRGLISRGMESAAGRQDYTMRRPSRRPNNEIVRPSMHAPVPKVAVVIDTSGSMSQDDLTAAMRETQGAIQAVGASMHILACDTESVDGVQHVRSIGEVVLKGGGGTDMVAGIATALTMDPDVVVVMTDGYTPWPPNPVGTPVIIVLIGEGPFGPEWASNLRVKPS